MSLFKICQYFKSMPIINLHLVIGFQYYIQASHLYDRKTWKLQWNLTLPPKFEQDFTISKFCKIEIKRKIYITRLILKIQDSNFTCKPNFYSRKNHILALRSKDHFFNIKLWYFQKNSSGCMSIGGPEGGV